MSTGESTATKMHGHLSISDGKQPANPRVAGQQCLLKPLLTGPLASEASFYSRYSWCLDAFPTIREVLGHLSEELGKLESAKEDWQQSEVITNVFLLSCAITDAVDDYVAGYQYDFSKVGQILPLARSGVRAVESLLKVASRLRAARLFRLHRWRDSWAAAVTEFLQHSMVPQISDRMILLQLRDRLTHLLPADFPAPFGSYRSK